MNVLRLTTNDIFIDQENKCACLEGGDCDSSPVNARMCDITCKEEIYCGGEDYVNVYNVGKCFFTSFTCFITMVLER
jgi:hypothetical protein